MELFLRKKNEKKNNLVIYTQMESVICTQIINKIFAHESEKKFACKQ